MVIVTALIIVVALKRHVIAGLVGAESAFCRSTKCRIPLVDLKREVVRADIVAETCVTQECGMLLISIRKVVKLITNCFRHTATYALKLFLQVHGLAFAMHAVDSFSVVDQLFAVLRGFLIMMVDGQTLHGEA